ncbi:6-phosphogluconolactonase [Atractiella rhizophila]|nr:6-phosphogluconolactonase [Atractiella rhizophila]
MQTSNGHLDVGPYGASSNGLTSPRSPGADSDVSQYATVYPRSEEGITASSAELPPFGDYPDPVVFSFNQQDELSEALAEFVLEAQNQSIRLRGRFTVALSGGSLPKLMTPGLIENPRVQWDKWIIFFADERLVPLDHPDSNYKSWMDQLLAHVPLDDWQIRNIRPYDELETKPGDVAEQVTEAYEASLTEVFGTMEKAPVFDLVLLGMGEDGHTASLFPGHPLLKEQEWFVVWIGDSPKPPSYRITFTYPMINSARRIAFVATGSGKQAALRDVLENDESQLPAAMVRLRNHPIVWFVDEAASQGTNYTLSAFWDEEDQ